MEKCVLAAILAQVTSVSAIHISYLPLISLHPLAKVIERSQPVHLEDNQAKSIIKADDPWPKASHVTKTSKDNLVTRTSVNQYMKIWLIKCTLQPRFVY